VNEIVRRKLCEARRRLVLGEFLHHLAWALFAAACLLFLLRALAPAQSQPLVWLILAAFPLAVLLGLAAWRWREPRAVAVELDIRARTKDRFLTALGLEQDAPAPFEEAVRREVSAFLTNWSPRQHLPFRLDALRFLWLLLPLAAWLALNFWQDAHRARLQPELTKAQTLLEQTRRLAETAKEEKNREALEELKRAEERLKSSPEPLRDAMRALAEFERRLAQSSDALSAQDMAALAQALADTSPQTAEALRSGRNDQAAENIAKMDPDALKRALQQAEQHLQNQKLREMLHQAAQKMQQQLSAMLQNSGGQSGESRRLRAMMRDLKDGAGGGRQEQANGRGGREGMPPGENPPGKEKSTAGNADNAPPGGAAGSEKDTGRGKPIEGEKDPADADAPEDFVAGQMGDGTSLVQAFRSSGNQNSAAARAYKSAYETAAPAELDAVNREEIAPGSRILVRRYFESIRPKE